jgi:hypothetical protein
MQAYFVPCAAAIEPVLSLLLIRFLAVALLCSKQSSLMD